MAAPAPEPKKPTTPRLVSIKLPMFLGGGLGQLPDVTLDQPPNQLAGWQIVVRGPAVMLVSPPGWRPGAPLQSLAPDGDQLVIEVARAECVLRWSAGPLPADRAARDEESSKMQRLRAVTDYVSPPLVVRVQPADEVTPAKDGDA